MAKRVASVMCGACLVSVMYLVIEVYCQTSFCNSCDEGGCNSTSGICVNGCRDGYWGDTCMSECPVNCTRCKRYNGSVCTACKDGYYNGNLDNIPFSDCSLTCQSECKSCQTFSNCHECNGGYYGEFCSSTCSVGCNNSVCDKDDGSCSCKSGFTGEMCDECTTGYFGLSCELECPEKCKQGTECRQSDGYCLGECADGKTGDYCLANCTTSNVCKSCAKGNSQSCTGCIVGKYGPHSGNIHYHCSYDCPNNCINNTCNGTTGNCVYGCIDGYKGDKCKCPSVCATCDVNGQCSSCKEGFGNTGTNCQCRNDTCMNEACDSCMATWYPDTGSQSCCQCNSTCKDNECSSATECLKGCKEGYYGYGCHKVCSDIDANCTECATENGDFSRCTKCKEGYYPPNTTGRCAQCSSNCLNGTCDRMTGECVNECNDGFWGDQCERACHEACLKCDRENGTCEMCKDDKYSRNCSLDCNKKCIKGNNRAMCDIDDGTCYFGCSNNKTYGPTCNVSCNEKCLDSVCDWKRGECVNCVANTHGIKYDKECDRNCLSDDVTSTRCSEHNGTCLFGCQPGYFGNMCGNNCSTHCKDITCDMASGECNHGCRGEFSDTMCLQAKTTREADSNGADIGAIVGGAVGTVIVVTVVIVLVFILRKRRNKNLQHVETASDAKRNVPQPSGTGSPLFNTTYEPVDFFAAILKVSVEATTASTYCEETPTLSRISKLSIPSKDEINLDMSDNIPLKIDPAAGKIYYSVERRTHVDELAEYISHKQKDDFEKEFKDFPDGLVRGRSYTDSQKTENMAKNRFQFVYPCMHYDVQIVKSNVCDDEYRVKLTGPGTDYINASYLDGFNQKNAYIACQGPTKTTTDNFVNFWRMVWQQNVEKIVMVTNLFENESNKCEKYWPDVGTSVGYGDVTVQCCSEDVYSDYIFRSFTISQESQKRSLYHIQFTAWPDKTVPDDVTSLIEFRQNIKSIQTRLNGPTIVHCSAGVGRTGTYIALDILTNQGEMDRCVDIIGCVRHMREHRVNMVQTAEQYEYLHNAIVHSLTFHCEAIPAEEFQQYFSSISDAKMAKKFKQLQSTMDKTIEAEQEAIDRNKTFTWANRAGSDIPGDRYRPILLLNRTAESTDYINAVYIDSFKAKNRYIVAQTPLPETVLDFLSLVYQSTCSCIVSMEPLEALKEETVGTYFPTDKHVLGLGKFTVTSVKRKSTPHYIIRELTIAHNSPDRGTDEKRVYHFQYTQWKEHQRVPDNPSTLLEMITDVENRANMSKDGGPILIHCLNGGEKSGLFCAVSVLIQKLEIEHEVSVVNTVRKVKSRRGNAIPNEEQYSFCYQCVSAFLQSFDIYSNFSLRI